MDPLLIALFLYRILMRKHPLSRSNGLSEAFYVAIWEGKRTVSTSPVFFLFFNIKKKKIKMSLKSFFSSFFKREVNKAQ
jgi:hypothetical protein